MIEDNEIFIQIKRIGFTFLLDKRMKHNFISPVFMAFFNLGEKQDYSLPIDDIKEDTIKPTFDMSLPFLPDQVNSISFGHIFHYVGKKVARCKDNKLRVCKVFILGFVYEEFPFSFPFFLDKSLDEPAILSTDSFSQMTKSVMKQRQEI